MTDDKAMQAMIPSKPTQKQPTTARCAGSTHRSPPEKGGTLLRAQQSRAMFLPAPGCWLHVCLLYKFLQAVRNTLPTFWYARSVSR